jgi:hypothetical protein
MICLLQSARSEETSSRFSKSAQRLSKPRKVVFGDTVGRQIYAWLYIIAIWVHDKKVMSHAALGSDLRSQKS